MTPVEAEIPRICARAIQYKSENTRLKDSKMPQNLKSQEYVHVPPIY